MQTDRLILRPLRETDLDDLLGLYNTPEVSKGYAGSISQKTPKFKDKVKDIAEGAAFHAVITLKDTGEFVGECALTMSGWARNRNACYTIGMMPQYQGKGYGKEASKYVVDYGFAWLGLHRITIEVFGNNTRAIALYESIGFVIEGRKRDFHWLDGEWVDDLDMGLLDKEHAAIKAKEHEQ